MFTPAHRNTQTAGPSASGSLTRTHAPRRADPIARLQRSAGNLAVQRLARSHTAHPAQSSAQGSVEGPARPGGRVNDGVPALLVGEQDAYEHEAERVAAEMTHGERPAGIRPHVARSSSAASLQRMPSRQGGSDAASSDAGLESEARSEAAFAPASVHETLAGSGQPLDAGARSYFEPRFGVGFGDVRVHTDARAAASAREVDAAAYTVGRDIVFDSGMYTPGSSSGRELIAHELAHVVQQGAAPNAQGVLQRAPRKKKSAPEPETSITEQLTYIFEQVAAFPGESVEEMEDIFVGMIVDIVGKLRAGKSTSLDAADEEMLLRVLERMPPRVLKKIEKELLLWPKFGHIEKMTKIIELVTGLTRKGDAEESERGRFSEAEGEAIKNTLTEAEKKFVGFQCLNFLYQSALAELYAGETDAVDAAKADYSRGASERSKTTDTHAKTLSRLAAELRLRDLTGPVNILRWVGRGESAHHDPNPADLFDRLSSAGDGWYFFLASVVSFHTFIIAVHVTGGGSSRRYFKIDDGGRVAKSRSALTEFFDDEFPNAPRAYSRVWQVYSLPAE